jgi:hypothetical protein
MGGRMRDSASVTRADFYGPFIQDFQPLTSVVKET